MQLIAADIGGTHARFAVATISDGNVVAIDAATTLQTAGHMSLQSAWREFSRRTEQPLPRAAAIAIAAPIHGEWIRLTNNPWSLHPASLATELEVDDLLLVNDFEAVAHAVAQARPDDFRHLCGPDAPLPQVGATSIVGPGTGLGVALLIRRGDDYHVQPTEGGHADFAPLDAIEDRLLARLRQRHRRVSVERVVSGPGLREIHETLAAMEGCAIPPVDDRTLWTAGLERSAALASAAVDRFCLSLGSVAGDIALTQGADSVVIAGGLGLRIGERLVRSGFAERFRAKGRFEPLMAEMPVRLITHPQPGLFGAAGAFARRQTDRALKTC